MLITAFICTTFTITLVPAQMNFLMSNLQNFNITDQASFQETLTNLDISSDLFSLSNGIGLNGSSPEDFLNSNFLSQLNGDIQNSLDNIVNSNEEVLESALETLNNLGQDQLENIFGSEELTLIEQDQNGEISLDNLVSNINFDQIDLDLVPEEIDISAIREISSEINCVSTCQILHSAVVTCQMNAGNNRTLHNECEEIHDENENETDGGCDCERILENGGYRRGLSLIWAFILILVII